MDALHRYRSILIFSILAGMFLAACSGEQTGPSNDKVRLDLQEWLDMQYNQLVQVENMEVDKRDVLAEDRVNFELTVNYSVDEAEIDQAIDAFKERRRITGTYQDPPDKALLMRIDGSEERLDMRYELQSGGVWNLSRLAGLQR